MSNWIAETVGLMHINKITNIELGQEMGVTPQYISEILNEKKSPKDIEPRVRAALQRIISNRG